MRVAIAGMPRSGKTTLAVRLCGEIDHPIEIHSTDILMGSGLDWSEESLEVSKWFDVPGDLIVEGMVVTRALRKWLANNPTGRPVDKLIWLGTPHIPISDGSVAMGKGAMTVLVGIMPELMKRGVEFEQVLSDEIKKALREQHT